MLTRYYISASENRCFVYGCEKVKGSIKITQNLQKLRKTVSHDRGERSNVSFFCSSVLGISAGPAVMVRPDDR